MGWGGGSPEAREEGNVRDDVETADQDCGSWKLHSGWKKMSGAGEHKVGFSRETYPCGSKDWRGLAKVDPYWTYLVLPNPSPRS